VPTSVEPPNFQQLWGDLFSMHELRQLAKSGGIGHTPTMTLKNAALLALIGSILATALLAWNLIFSVLNVLRGVVPPVMLFSSLIFTFGAVSATVFFFVFHKTQK
jgi:hypothetical protein